MGNQHSGMHARHLHPHSPSPRQEAASARRRKSLELPDLTHSLSLSQQNPASSSQPQVTNPGKGKVTTQTFHTAAKIAIDTSKLDPNPDDPSLNSPYTLALNVPVPINPQDVFPRAPPDDTVVAPSLPPVPLPLVQTPAVNTAALVADIDKDKDAEKADAVRSATVDFGAGPDGIPTLLTWKPAAEGTEEPKSVYVTGTFANDWSTKVQLRPTPNQSEYSALLNLKPGPHRLKFVVNEQWKTSRHLPSATDTEGNLINYLQIYRSSSSPPMKFNFNNNLPVDPETTEWTTEIPPNLLLYATDDDEDYDDDDDHNNNGHPENRNNIKDDSNSRGNNDTSASSKSISNSSPTSAMQQQQKPPILPAPSPPTRPAQLDKGVLNQAVLVQAGSGDDNSILSRPDHSVIDHLAATPISKGLLSVGVTKRYKRKYVTTVFYKPVPSVPS